MNFDYKSVFVGVFLSLGALVIGELHGMAFGAKEADIKAGYKKTAQASVSVLKSPEAQAKAASKAWKYLKRAHMHFMGLGTAALVLCLFLGLMPGARMPRMFAAIAVGFGAFIYPLFWTLVSFKTAAVGAGAAKESLGWIAQIGAGLGFLGLIAICVLAVLWALGKTER